MSAVLEGLMRKVSGTPDWRQHGGFLRAHRTLQRTFDQANAIAPLRGASLKQWLHVAEPLVARAAKLHGGAMPGEEEEEEDEEDDEQEHDEGEGEGDESDDDDDTEREEAPAAAAAAPAAAARLPSDLVDLETGAPSDAAPATAADTAAMAMDYEPAADAAEDYDEAEAPPQDLVEAEAGHDETVEAAEAEAPAVEDEGTVSAPFQKRLAALHALLQRAPEAAPESAAAAAMPQAPDVVGSHGSGSGSALAGGALGSNGRGVRKALPLFPSAAVAAAGGGLRRARHTTQAQQLGGAMRGGAPLPMPKPQGSLSRLEQLTTTGRPGVGVAPGNVIQYGYGGCQKPGEFIAPKATNRR